MSCPALIDPACVIVPVITGTVGAAANAAANAAASGALAGIAGSVQSAIAWVVSGTVDWWVRVPSPDLTAEPAVGALQQWLLPITGAVAVLAVITAAGKMAITRKASPLIDVGSGLAIIAATSAIGVLLPAMLLKAGDAWSSWVLTASTGGQFGARLTTVLTMPGAAPGVVIVLGVIAIIMAAIQAVLMLFRQAAVVILAGLLPLAAAGTLAPATRAWFRRVTGWMLALIFYKPAAAAVYATAFSMIGTGKDPRTILMGFAMVILSLLALPVLMKFFTWTTSAVEAAGGGGGFLGTMLSGAVAIGAVRGSMGGWGGSSAVDQARMMSAQFGPPGGAPSGAGSPVGAQGTATGSSPGAARAPDGPSGAVAAPAAGAAGTAPVGLAGGAASGAAGGGAASGSAGAAGAGGGAAASGAAAAAGAAAGPVGLLAAGAAQAGQQVTRAAQQAASAMQPGEDGSGA